MQDPRLATIVQMLQQQPSSYRGFGWLWYGLKALLKTQFSSAELSGLGGYKDEALLEAAVLKYKTPTALIRAAQDHFQVRAVYGEIFAADDHLPDGTPVRVTDLDMGFANL